MQESRGERLDAFLAAHIPEMSRSRLQKLIAGGHVLVNDRSERPSYRVQAGDVLTVTITPSEPLGVAPQSIPLDVFYEDEQILVINKPKGMAVHPAPGSPDGTLVNAVLAHCGRLSGIGGVERPGIVHRLDKDTSGLLVVAKTDLAHSILQRQIQKRTAERRYLAIVWGGTRFNKAEVDAPIGRHPTDRKKMAVIKDTDRYTARKAVTHLTVVERFGAFTLVEAKLDTGRTHQIRIHCSFTGHPVVGDPVYGGTRRSLPSTYSRLEQKELSTLLDTLQGQALHAYKLSFDHPESMKRMTFEAPLPADMQALLDWLRRSIG